MVNDLPLLDLFVQLREAGLPLGVGEYNLLLRALPAGFGLSDRDALARLCGNLWVKSDEQQRLFDFHFAQVMANVPVELPVVVEQKVSSEGLPDVSSQVADIEVESAEDNGRDRVSILN